jgi:hypothetical protein
MIFGMATPPFRVMFLIYRAHRSEIKEENCLISPQRLLSGVEKPEDEEAEARKPWSFCRNLQWCSLAGFPYQLSNSTNEESRLRGSNTLGI